jgi:CubicO group peptidase (beta-lactamase class C family)
VVLVDRGDEPIFVEGYGLSDRERGVPWTPATVSTIGSITKQFTGAAILLLHEEGRLSVEDPITKHFPDVPEDKRPITLHQLLTHSSGIVDLDGLGDWDPIGRDEFVRRAMTQPLAFAPGEGYRYSNAGYSLLGVIIEQITGGSYEQFVRQHLFLPSGMFETGYVLAPWSESRLARGYVQGERWGTVLERPLDDDGPYWVLRANGGIHSTAYDMLRWARALTAGRVLSSASMERYWAPHVHEGGDSHYGYGWVVMTAPPDLKVITHNGGNGILFADMAIVPEAKAVIFLQTNVVSDFPLAQSLLEHIGRRLLAGVAYPVVPDIVEVTGERLAPLSGEYELNGGALRVSNDDRGLLVDAQGPHAFAHLHSSRPVDLDRCDRLSGRIDAIVSAWLGGDFTPLHEAYGGRTSIERLRTGRLEAMRQWEGEHGPFERHVILGSAMRPGRDATVVRFLFERGVVDRAYIWDMDAPERLLGYSVRGIDATLRFHAVAGVGFASWDRMTGTTKALRFDRGADGRPELVLGTGDGAIHGRRR